MESVLKSVECGNEDRTFSDLCAYNETNKTNFNLGDDIATREAFCSTVLEGLSSGRWSPRTQAAALTALRIIARAKTGVSKLRTRVGLGTLVRLADMSHDIKESCFCGNSMPQEKVEVIVEAVKCLCNIVLSTHTLTTTCAELGVLHGLSLRLRLVRNMDLPPDILTFDLRLLFLITACGVAERVKFRDEYEGLYLLVNIVDAILFGRTTGDQEVVAMASETDDIVSTETTEVKDSGAGPRTLTSVANSSSGCEGSSEVQYLLPLPPLRDSVCVLTAPLGEERLGWVAEAMKVVFNQTVHWKEDEAFSEDEKVLLGRVVILVRIMLVSVPFQLSKLAMDTITHCVEVLVNTPLACVRQLLLPAEVQIMPTLQWLYPGLYRDTHGSVTAGGATAISGDVIFDEIHEQWNMSSCACLLQLLLQSLDVSHTTVSTVLTVLRYISKGHRDIRRFLKNKILPPVREVTQRPEQGDSLKGRLVRLMTASGGQGAENVAAEFLFVLCKEDASRLIRHTGYGNAAGLLLSRGLLGGGKSDTAGDYSSDSDSDTCTDESINPVTGGPSDVRGEERERMSHMTDEEKEREAVKLVQMMQRLNEHGVIRVLPMDGQPDLPLD